MPKQIFFLRHYQMAFPFDEAKNLNQTQSLSLITHQADPDIKSDIQDFLKANFSKSFFDNTDLIFSSDYRRTYQTAIAILKYINRNIPIVQNSLFNEIPSRVVENSDEIHPKTIRIYGALETKDRLKQIDNLLVNTTGTKFFVISHSYLIGQLNYWYNIIDRDESRYNFAESTRYEIGGYLKGFLYPVTSVV